MRPAVLIALFAAGLTLIGAERAAFADKPRIVVADFTGPSPKKARAGVVRALKKKAELISFETFVGSLRTIGDMSEEGFAKACKALNVDAVLVGVVAKNGRNRSLIIGIRRGADGKLVKGVKYPLTRSGRLRTRHQRKITKQLSPVLVKIAGGDYDPNAPENAGGDDDGDIVTMGPDDVGGEGDVLSMDPDVLEKKPEGGGEGDVVSMDPDVLKKPDEKKKTEPEKKEDEREPEKVTDTRSAPTVTRVVEVRGPARYSASLGFSMLQRNLSFSVPPTEPNAPRPYEGLIPVYMVSLSGYPLAWLQKPVVRDLGLKIDAGVSRPFLSDVQGLAFDFVTQYSAISVDLMHRLRYSIFEVRTLAGYGMANFPIDPPEELVGLPGIPVSVAHRQFRFGVEGGVELGTNTTITFGGRGLYSLSAGDIESMDTFGSATGLGFDADAGLKLRFIAGLFVNAGLRYSQMKLSFNGEGALADTDGDGEANVTDATDRYISGQLFVGYDF